MCRSSAWALPRVLAALLAAVALSPRATAASSDSSHDGISGSYPGRVLTEIALHRQAAMRRARLGFQTQSLSSSAVIDVGNIVVMPDDGTLVNAANSFDLDQKSLSFQPSGGGYTVSAGASAFDSSAAGQGVLLNPTPPSNPQNIGDDGSREVALPFPFLFFGNTYNSVFINSDGNLTFGSGDDASSDRSLGRLLSGAPRIAPYFADLDPSLSGQLTYVSSPGRFVVTWNQVGDFASSGIGPRETFQVALMPDGRIQFSYAGIHGTESVAGISPGHFTDAPGAVDLSGTSGQTLPGPIAEVFTRTTALDVVAVAQRFYQTHDDACQFLVVFTNFEFNLNGAFAYELNIANQVTGLGLIGLSETFDFSGDFGAARLESLLNMGNIARYPANPSTVFLRGIDSTLSIMGQESGHRFEAYTLFIDPETGRQSTGLLGRSLQHWSFFFNSDGSVLEGNRIRDNGGGTFTAIGAVDRYSEIDQYLMGLREPGEVSPTFLVKNPSPALSPGTPPAPPSLNFTFSGHRVDVPIGSIIAANGLRTPNSVTSRKLYNYAFILVIPRGAQPDGGEVAHVDSIRRAWETFYVQATSFRATANTALVRSLQIKPSSLGLLPGSTRQVTVELASAPEVDLGVQLSNSNSTAVFLPPEVVIPAGARSVSIPVSALTAGGSLPDGRAVIEASAPGYETASLVVQVPALENDLRLTIAGGNNQWAAPGDSLPQPLHVALSDTNHIPYPGVGIAFQVLEGDASVSPGTMNTDEQGNAAAAVQLGSASGPVKIRASLSGTPLFVDFAAFVLGVPEVPPNGIVNGASFELGPSSRAPEIPAGVAGLSIVSIFGTDLAPFSASAAALPLPITLGGTSVTFDGIPAHLFYVSPTQINALVPFAPFPTQRFAIPIVVHNALSESVPTQVEVRFAIPGIFTQDSSGSGAGAIQHNASGSLVTPQDPAIAGEFLRIYATGIGGYWDSTPAVSVKMNGMDAPVSFAGRAPGFEGLAQINVRMPDILDGTAQVVVSQTGVSSPPVTMAVGN